MRHLFLFLFCCCFIGLHGNVYFRHLSKPEGLSQISVVSICQDEVGRMWFGTLEGLNCYDGNRITVYKPASVPEADFLGNEVHNLASDKRGNIFFTTDDKLVRYDLHQEYFEDTGIRNVSALCTKNQDIYIAVSDSIFRWNNEERRFGLMDRMQPGHKITCLYADSFDGMWVGTSAGLYYVADVEDMHSSICVIPKVNIYSLYVDSHRRLWVATFRKGMCVVEKLANGNLSVRKNAYILSNNDVRCFMEDETGSIWVGTFDGLNKIEPDGRVSCYRPNTSSGSLSHASVFSLYKDSQGGIWVGTFYGGVNYFHPKASAFSHYSNHDGQGAGVSFPYVGNMVEDKRGNVWICTEGGGLNCWDRKTDTFSYYLMEQGEESFLNLKCIAYDEEYDCLYIGTHKQNFLRFDISTGRVHHYTDSKLYGTSFSEIVLQGDSLFLLASNGLFVKSRHADDSPRRVHLVDNDIFSYAVTFLEDTSRQLWVSSRQRSLVRIDRMHGNEVHVYSLGQGGLGNFVISKMVESPSGEIFLGTSGAGLYRWNKDEDNFSRCLLPDVNYIYQMKCHVSGYLVLLTDRGVICYHPQTNDIKILDADAQLHLSALNEGCGLLICRDDEVLVGGSDGMTAFAFSSLFEPQPSYRLYFSSLHINGCQVSVANVSNAILQEALPFASSVSLAYDDNNISISVASDDYVTGLTRKVYEYRLEGFDKSWRTVPGSSIVYTNLDPGRYKLWVRERSLNTPDRLHGIALQIVVNAPWWATWWAYILYAVLIVGIGSMFVRNRIARMRLRASLLQEKLEKEKNEELIQAKLQFFANISHEFRTPLTLIMTQLESLLHTSGLSPHMRVRLQRIYRNTSHFRELISELLDFRKLERGKMTLKVVHSDLISYLRQVCEDFQAQALVQHIRLEFFAGNDLLLGWFDYRQLRKVFTNLLSNALKYTPAGGKVEMLVVDKGNQIEIKVADSGEGIPPESIPFIFDRFYQANAKNSSPSSGIGLALAKGIVELHHGTISVQSALTYGSIFTVTLPKENPFVLDENVKMATPDEVRTLAVHTEMVLDNEIGEQENMETVTDSQDDGKDVLLLVEDNEELLQALVDLLSPVYRIVIAMDGQTGYEKALEERPDIIVSDVMMPIMSGTEMCKKIKSNFDLCHIPVILLTALVSDQDKLEGLQCGADDYIEKPFNNQLLLGSIANLLRIRRLLRKKFEGNLSSLDNLSEDENISSPLPLNPIDADFLMRIKALVHEHLGDPDWDVAALAHELGISRSSLYGKLKALGRMTPNEFILQARLECAAGLLKEHPEMQISEIAYQCGFNSLRYFRQCFKARYKKSPLEFRQE